MLGAVEKLRLCELYQLLPERTPAPSARARRLTMRVSQCNNTHTSREQGNNGRRSLYPFWGRFQEVVANLNDLSVRTLRGWGGLQWYACALVLMAIALAAALVRTDPSLGAPLWIIIALCGVALLAERQSVHITATTQMSVSALPILFAAVVYGPLAAMAVAASALLLDYGQPYTRWLIWTFSRSLVGGLAGVAAGLLITEGASFGGLVLAVAAASVVEAVGDITLNAITIALRRNGSFMDTAHAMARLMLSTVPLYTPVIAALAYSYRELSPWTVLLFFVPALAAQRLLTMYQEQARLVADLGAANIRLERASLSFASALVAALDARDQYTAGHSAAVAVYARDIAERLGLDDADQQLAHLCGLVHDIGKVGLPAGLLEKPGPLTLDERRRMEEHSVIGERILGEVDDYAEIARIVRHHHERVDGGGYPDGLAGDAVPLISRILSVADAYNAMTSGRPYRDAMPSRVARLRLAQAVGSQFDTTVVAAFEAILATAGEPYLAGARADFALEAQRHASLGTEFVATVA
jgi:putative nucleotidyltransferase with HDIG domain